MSQCHSVLLEPSDLTQVPPAVSSVVVALSPSSSSSFARVAVVQPISPSTLHERSAVHCVARTCICDARVASLEMCVKDVARDVCDFSGVLARARVHFHHQLDSCASVTALRHA